MDKTRDSYQAPEWPAQKAQNGHHDWTKNEKIKTAKCDTCDERVRTHSWTCTKCKKHICSECAVASGQSKPIHKFTAKYQLGDRCFCAFPSTTPPGFARKVREAGLLPSLGAPTPVPTQAGPSSSGRPSQPNRLPVGEPKHPLDSPHDITRSKRQRISSVEIQAFEPTIASVKPSRRGAKAVRYDEDSDEETKKASSSRPIRPSEKQRKSVVNTSLFVEEDEGDSAPGEEDEEKEEDEEDEEDDREAAPVPCTYMNDGSTVIVGGGIIGLCVAFELARKCYGTRTRHNITLVEIQGDCCSLSTASGNCAGILSGIHMDKKFEPLIAQAEEAWQDLEEIFKLNGGSTAVDFKRDNILGVYTHKGQGRNKRPTWYHGHEMDIFDAEEDHVGKIDTRAFASWLERQCKKLGVRFVYDHQVVSISSDPNNKVEKVGLMSLSSSEPACSKRFADAEEAEAELRYLECQNLVLAAGPWTTGILQDVLFEADVGLSNSVRTAYTFVVDVEMATKAEKDDVGLLLPFVGQDDKCIEPRIGMAARVSQQQVTIFGTAKQIGDAHLSVEDALQPSLGSAKPFGRIRDYAGRRLDPLGGDGRYLLDSEGARSRYAKVSTSEDGLPFVGRLPSSPPGSVDTKGQNKRPGRIWLCDGFGMHGTFLGPGAAHALVADIFSDSKPGSVTDMTIS